MKKFFFVSIILSFFSLIWSFFPKKALATEKINKFGIHILEPSDLEKAQELVNSSGGDWGWVTIVIRDDDLNHDKWQKFMDNCREKHLIPIVRIATHVEGSYWVKPKVEDVQKWTNFLSSLNWPTENKYVIIFNEPNQAKEWNGEINPKEYARILSEFSDKFHSLDSKFLILNSGFDLAAPNGKETMDALKFMEKMNEEVTNVFEKIDAWASHSYPNHGYLGKPWETGRTSVRGYEWELSILKNNFKIKKDLPVLITETGWPKIDKKTKGKYKKYYDEIAVAAYLKNAYENVWLKDNKVKAVTPFVLNYPGELFYDFSWLDKNGQPFLQYNIIKSLPKENWWPKQEEKFEIKSLFLPSFLPVNTIYRGNLILKNTGQSILGERGETEIPAKVKGDLEVSNLKLNKNNLIKPGETVKIEFSIKSGKIPGEFSFSWGNLPEQKIKVFPPSILYQAKYNFWEKVVLKIREIFNF